MKKETIAHKLPFDHGEFLCTWAVKGPDGESIDVPGLLTLEAGKYPQGALHGDLPVISTNGMTAFPQRNEFECLTGRLSNGGSVSLMNGSIDYYFVSQGRATGAFAVLSRSGFSTEEVRQYTSVTLQMDGLDAIFGQAPIIETSFPRTNEDDPIWTAKLNRKAGAKWEIDSMQMSMSYSSSIRTADPYEFRIVSSAVLTLTSREPLTIEEWWTGWILHLRRLLSLIIRESSYIHSVLATPVGHQLRATKDQVFGLGITQEMRNSSTDRVRSVDPLVNISDDNANLLELLVNWKSQTDNHHPLLETYGTMLTVSEEEHPRSRVLLYLQALEGLYGFETSEARVAREASYKGQRAEVIQRVKESSLDVDDIKFIKDNLQRRPNSGLQDALKKIFDSLVVDLRAEIDGTSVVESIRSSYPEFEKVRVEQILVKLRNDLSHGSANYEPHELGVLATVLERIVRSEALRVVNSPASTRERALLK